MSVQLQQIGQIAFNVSDVDRAEDFYGHVLGLRKLFRFGDLAFFDCGTVRLLLERSSEGQVGKGAVLYFRAADIALTRRALEERGVRFIDTPHLVAPMEDHDLWMSFFEDPDGHVLALMMEAPKGYTPA